MDRVGSAASRKQGGGVLRPRWSCVRAQKPSRQRVSWLLASALLAGACLVSPAFTGLAAASVAQLAGHTTVRASGITGVVLEAPADTGLVPGSADIQFTNGTFAHLFLHDPDNPDEDDCGFCPLDSFTVVPEMTELGDVDGRPGVFGTSNSGFCSNDAGDAIPCLIRQGLLEIYIISDGDVVFSADFVDLDGEIDVTAGGIVDARLERLPIRECPGGDCERWAIGGVTHDVGLDGPGRVFGFAYAEIAPSDLIPGYAYGGSVSVAGCSYPSWFVPSGSPDPDDHPLGCDLTPDPQTLE